MWKSDIAEAYWLMPLHPFWQIKQINTIYDNATLTETMHLEAHLLMLYL